MQTLTAAIVGVGLVAAVAILTALVLRASSRGAFRRTTGDETPPRPTHPRLSDLWSLRGTVGRGTYAFWGVLLGGVKYGVDRVVAGVRAEEFFRLQHYWFPGDFFGVLPTTVERAQALLPMLLTTLPFVWVGVVLTLRRARAAGLPGGTVLLFFVPVVNLILFAVLCALPSRSRDDGPAPSAERGGRLARLVPESRFGSAAAAILVTLPATAVLTIFATKILQEYGWGLFVGLPFFLGLASAVLHGTHHVRSAWSCVLVAWTAVLLLALLFVAIAVEGLLCVLMAAPIALVLSTFGALVGWVIQNRPEGGRDAGSVVASVVLVLPGAFALEHAAGPEPAMLEVVSVVEVDAPPEVVWEHVIAFAELPPPTELLFRAGVAYPLRAEIHGKGVGAVRHCVFSTGPFVEPIEVWDAPRRLEFSVSAQPPTMRELSPYPDLAPPHLEHFLASHRGRFLLEPLPGGRTRLEGTTWYTNRMWPASYWRLWSDEVIHRIHVRVLEHIRRRAEAGA